MIVFGSNKSKGSGAMSKSGSVFGARTTEAEGGETTACVREPVNNKFAISTKVALDISLQSKLRTYTRSHIYITSTLFVPSKTESVSENINQGEG